MHASFLALVGCLSASMPAPQFLDQHDLIWEVPPLRWLEGIPLANGDIGALIWGDGAPLKFTLDKYDAWETREKPLEDLTYGTLRGLVTARSREDAEQCMRTEHVYGEGPRPTRLPMPRLEIDFGRPVVWTQARLSLRTATATITGEHEGAPFRLEAAVHADKNLLMVRMEGRTLDTLRIRATLDHLDAGAKETLKRWGYPEPEVTTEKDHGALRFYSPTGYEYAVAWRLVPQGKDARTLYLALRSTLEDNRPLEAAASAVGMDRAQTEPGPDFDRASHETWWADYWSRSYLTIPDARLEALYYIEMYKLGCSSRPGRYPVTLQGLWTLDGGMPPWAGDYHLDMNVQQSYWPIYTANRLDLGEPLYRTFSACLPKWRDQCRQFFGFDGIWSGCAIGPKGERIYGYSGVELWPGNAAWLAHHYWLHFLYSQDKAFLRDQAMPIMRLAFLTYANLLEPGDDGKLHVPLSYSPEWGEGGFNAYCKDANCDLALIRFLAGAILKSNDILGVMDETTDRARDVLERLADYQQADGHLLVSAGTPLSHSHRHHSHLMAIHPLGLITRDGTEAERALLRNALYDIRVQGTGEWTGWAFPWMSLIASRAGYGNMAWQMLDTYANAFIKPNTFHVNGDPRIFGYSLFDYEPMTLEAGFGAAAAVMEMLLQSYNGVIRVFPAVPDRWHDAYFANLRAEGAFLVTAKLSDGAVRFVQVASEAGLPCEVVNPFGGAATLDSPDSTAGAAQLNGDRLRFDTRPGGTYLLYPNGQKPSTETLQPASFVRAENERNFYGVKRLPRY